MLRVVTLFHFSKKSDKKCDIAEKVKAYFVNTRDENGVVWTVENYHTTVDGRLWQ